MDKLDKTNSQIEDKPIEENCSHDIIVDDNTEDYQESVSVRPKWLFGILTVVVISALLMYLFLPHFMMRKKQDNSHLSQSQISRSILPMLKIGSDDPEVLMQMQKLQLIYDLLRENYYRELSDKEIIEAMYSGMLEMMDSPYTFYLSNDDYSAMVETMSGEYSGIGAQVSQRNDVYIISDIFDGSPAAEAGLLIGDQFISIDGQNVSDFTDVGNLSASVRGKEGSIVEIEIFRPSEEEKMTFKVKRGKVQNANLKYEKLSDGIGYVRILEFNQGVAKNFEEALEKLEAEGVETIIFDLRNNGGGFVTEVTEMLDYLLPEGDLAVAKGRFGGEEFEEAWTSDKNVHVPSYWKYVILVNEFSASASELFTGCLRDYDKAIIVGQTTFGKGVGSITQELSDGSAIQITNFHYYLPKGDCVQDIGIKPDFEVEMSKENKYLPIGQIKHEDDEQFQAALREAERILKKLR